MDHSHFHPAVRIPAAVGRGVGRLVRRPGPLAMALLMPSLVLVIATDGQIPTLWRQVGLSFLLVLDIIMIAWLTRPHER